MTKEKKIFTAGLVAAMLPAMWAINLMPGASAQEAHTHAPAPTGAKQLQNPLSATEENIARGRALFGQHCASCHGQDGRAQTERAATMKVKPADLTSHAIHHHTPGEIFQTITNGIQQSGMPAFKERMSEQERWQTVLYVQHLSGGPAAANQPANEMQADHAQHATHEMNDHATMGDNAHAGHNMMSSMMTTATGGPFRSMHALGSGTALQPASTPMDAWHWMAGEWMLMLHGDLKVGYNQQGGPRGVGKAESENWLMLMAERQAGPGRLMLRGMFSAEPLTAPHGGFPELFQTGETYHRRPIIDAQHAHDLLMELAASYTVPISERVSLQIYGGPVAEPALGPVAFMHRASAIENPSAPLGHHWQDSTHITHGVVTGALTAWRFKFEVSGFHGAEPDEDRVGLDLGKLDSYSFRGWFTPTPNWAMQFSYGHLTKPEVLEPGDLNRMTASVSYNRPWTDGSWATTLIWGRNSQEHNHSNSYLLESTINFRSKNHLYTRIEWLDKAGLLVDNIFGRPGLVRAPVLPLGNSVMLLPKEFERSFRVAAFTFGGVRDFIAHEKLRVGIGADVVFYHKPSELDTIYGRRPTSFHVFLRFRPGEMH